MTSLIYRKSLSGSSSPDDLNAVTLMSSDMAATQGILITILEMCARTVEIVVGIWLLWRQLGAVSVAPILVVATCFVLQVFVASFMGPRQASWMEAVQRRVGQTSSILRLMKSVKLAGLSDSMIDLLQSERIRELNIGIRFRWLMVWQNGVGK